jgi:adenylate kinase family enzyme
MSGAAMSGAAVSGAAMNSALQPPLMLIDGRSGSGKSELATAIAARLPAVQLVRLDDVYPGWDGLEAASTHVHDEIIANARWQRWDWQTSTPAEWHELDPLRPVLVEGCGALSRANRAATDAALWVEYPTAGRKKRALAREPDFADHWDEWAAQEQAFIDRENPRSFADAIVDGAEVTADLDRWCALIERST